uniref:FAD/NAD(P)-binding domain-containing protein n=1 Tax=Gopherus evgoodei TaxID=1825980 RepID=A0A8C4W7K5_9SAUR
MAELQTGNRNVLPPCIWVQRADWAGGTRCLCGYALRVLSHAVVRSSEPNTACCPSLLQVVSVDMQGQKAHFQDGAFQRYDQLLIATGSSPRQLQCPGSDLENVCSLQTPEDANRILHLATGKRVVILGASFIGMEVAAFLSDKSSAICVVEREEFPFQAVLGPQVGGVAMKMLQNKSVKFYMKAEISELRGENRKVTKSLTPAPLLDCSQNLLPIWAYTIPLPSHVPSTGHVISSLPGL